MAVQTTVLSRHSNLSSYGCMVYICSSVVIKNSVLFPLFHRDQSAVSLRLSDYVQGLPESAKTRYLQKLQEIGCTVDPYVDSYDSQLSLLPTVKYSDICEFIGNHTVDGKDPQKAFKSLDSYHTVCSDGWMGSLNVKKCRNAVLIRCDVKPSQRSGLIYKTWVVVKQCGSVLCGHCTCMAGLSEVCNHVGAILYKTMHVTSDIFTECMATSNH